MLNTNNLSYWTLQSFPYILTPINKYEFFCLNNEQKKLIPTENHTFCFVKEGNVVATFSNNEKNETLTISAGMFVQWSGIGVLDFLSTEDNSSVLLMSFKILRPNQCEIFGENKTVNYSVPVMMQALTIEMPHAFVPEVGSVENRLLEIMCNEAQIKAVGHFNKIQLLLSEFVVEIVRNHPKIPRYIDAVAITSNTDDDLPLKKGREIYINDVEIWCGNPEDENSVLLSTMRANRYFVSNNGDTDEKINYESVLNDDGKMLGKLYSGDKNICYKVLLWPDSGIKPIDVDLYANQWLYVRTKIKSNMIGNIGIAVYATKGHHWFGSPFIIDKVNEWQDVVMPVMFVRSYKEVHRIVSSAIKYIHQNYSKKISLKSVAEAIYTNPNYLSTIFSKEKGITFSAYVKKYRLSLAQKLLVETDLSIEKIALEVGFYDIQHFSKLFKKELGVSPVNFRKANKRK